MSPRGRIIPAEIAERTQLEAFPYFAASFGERLEDDPEGDDSPLGTTLSTPEEDARRLASADQIIYEKMRAAEQEAQEIARRAYEDGFASGEAEGRAFGESQYRSFIQRLESHLEDLSGTARLLGQASQDEILALAFTMAEYLAGQQIEASPEGVAPLLQAILESHPFPTPDSDGGGNPALLVHLHPRDLELLTPAAGRFPALRLLEDPELSRGSLRLESPEGVMDATLERRRDRLMETLHRFREKD